MKKNLSILFLITLLLTLVTIAYADEKENDVLLIASGPNNVIKVQQNGEYIDFKDDEGRVVNPQIINDRTMVPFRKIFNTLGVKDENIMWSGDTRTVTAIKDGLKLQLQIDNTKATKTISGDEEIITLDSAPVIIDGRTLVPIRFIAESMDKKVGWDAKNRTVIIIDTEELTNDLEKSLPKYFELLNSDTNSLKTYSSKMNVEGNIEYKNSENKTDNSSIKISGTIKYNVTSDTIILDASLKATGEGKLFDELKESKLTDYDFNIIINENKLYIRSTSLNDKTNGKWAVLEDDSIKQIFNSINEETKSLKSIFEIDEKYLNIDTYKSLESLANIVKVLLKDENIQVTEKGNTKTYTITFNLLDIIKLLEITGMKVETNGANGTLKLTSVYKKGVAQSSGCELKIDEIEGNETLNVILNINGEISSDTTNSSLPDESQTMKFEEIKE